MDLIKEFHDFIKIRKLLVGSTCDRHFIINSSDVYSLTSFQIYLYEYGDLNVEPYPRHVLPFAVILYRYKEVSPTVKTPDTPVLMR